MQYMQYRIVTIRCSLEKKILFNNPIIFFQMLPVNLINMMALQRDERLEEIRVLD